MASGKAWAFPVAVDTRTGRIQEADTVESIRQSIRLILSTRPGERYYYPGFGCPLHKYVFGTADYTMLKQIEKEVQNSIERWEKRISSLSVSATTEDGVSIIVDIAYQIQGIDAMFHYSHILELR